MIDYRLKSLLKKRRCTLLGVGPMSTNCVDATIELANDFDVPLFLIASRRQIDDEEFGGGYVNKWTTSQFADYVIDKDKKGRILLARDHGGPWQGDGELMAGMGLRKAMDSAKRSYLADIRAGFQVLHIDPSIDPHGIPSVDEVIDRILELYEYCWIEAQKRRQDIVFEIGTEEQSGSTNHQDELDYTLNKVISLCEKNRLPQPSFVVVQSGTKVMERRNVGSFDCPIRVAREIPAEIQVPKMIEICERHGILMKEHNTDYLSSAALQWHPRLGIHAANVAPEFGVAESEALIDVLESNGLAKLADAFINISLAAGKWKKWMLPDSRANDRERAIIGGHYVFSHPETIELKMRAGTQLKKAGIDLQAHLKQAVKKAIFRYITNFRLVSTA